VAIAPFFGRYHGRYLGLLSLRYSANFRFGWEEALRKKSVEPRVRSASRQHSGGITIQVDAASVTGVKTYVSHVLHKAMQVASSTYGPGVNVPKFDSEYATPRSIHPSISVAHVILYSQDSEFLSAVLPL
jgi:hypothetical protein